MKNNKLKIVYEDKYILVINKREHLLSIASLKEKENTLYHQVYMYLKRKNKNNKVFIVHRLDYDTSGLIIFAKDLKTKQYFQDNWSKVIRKYVAVVNGQVEKEEDTLRSYLKETKTNLVYATKDSKNGALAITNYKKIKENEKYTLLDIGIKTGRKNQIRVQLQEIGNPILGDKKYGPKSPEKRMYLHAYYLKFYHPYRKEDMKLELAIPKEFLNKLT